MVVSLSKKSGKGISDRQVSELTAVFHVKPGHAEQLRAALRQFGEAIDKVDPKNRQKVGLRQLRLVLFDNDQRFLWTTSFETDWDPYIDDAVTYFGFDMFVGFLQHLVEYPFPDGSPVKATNADLKALLQKYQAPATWFYDVFGGKTMPEIIKALHVEQAFQQVLDNPDAAQALQHPAMKPLLAQAAD